MTPPAVANGLGWPASSEPSGDAPGLGWPTTTGSDPAAHAVGSPAGALTTGTAPEQFPLPREGGGQSAVVTEEPSSVSSDGRVPAGDAEGSPAVPERLHAEGSADRLDADSPTDAGVAASRTDTDRDAGDVSRETSEESQADRPDVSRETVQEPQLPPVRSADGASAAPDPEVSRETVPEPPPPPSATNQRPREPWPQPPRPRIITVANQKGGVGKTTSAVNLAAALSQHGARVLVIDLDPQGNASTAFGLDHREGEPSIYDVLVDGRPVLDVAAVVEGFPSLRCVPATIDVAGAEVELVPVVARETRLKRALDAIQEDFDYIFIDCPPSLGLLTVNALVAADEVLIPIQCEFYALEGLTQLLRNIELVRSALNEKLWVSTILLTMYDARTRLAEQVARDVRDHFGDLVVDAVIPRSVRISEAPGFGQTVLTFDPASRGAKAYVEAARVIAGRGAVTTSPAG